MTDKAFAIRVRVPVLGMHEAITAQFETQPRPDAVEVKTLDAPDGGRAGIAIIFKGGDAFERITQYAIARSIDPAVIEAYVHAADHTPPGRPCPLCDGDRVVVLGTGACADFFGCPACVGLRRKHMALVYRDDVEAMCESAGVAVIWLDA